MTRLTRALPLSRRSLAAVTGLLLTRACYARAQESDMDALVAAMTPREQAARMPR